MSAPVIFKFENKEQAIIGLVEALKTAISHALDEKGIANIALSGGSTPEPAYEKLAQENLDWSKINIALVDDRWVDLDDKGSNEAMLLRAFSKADGAKIISMKTNDESPQIGAPKIEEIYSKLRPFDAILLGMGPDAHTASWFAGANGLENILRTDYAQCVTAIDASHSEVGKAYPNRISLTLPPIAETPMLALLIFGEDKLKVFEQSVTGDASSKPIKAAIDAAQNGLVVFWSP